MVKGPPSYLCPRTLPTQPSGYHLLREDRHVRGGPLQREDGTGSQSPTHLVHWIESLQPPVGSHLLSQVVDDSSQGLCNEPCVAGQGFRVNPGPSGQIWEDNLYIFGISIIYNHPKSRATIYLMIIKIRKDTVSLGRANTSPHLRLFFKI